MVSLGKNALSLSACGSAFLHSLTARISVSPTLSLSRWVSHLGAVRIAKRVGIIFGLEGAVHIISRLLTASYSCKSRILTIDRR